MWLGLAGASAGYCRGGPIDNPVPTLPSAPMNPEQEVARLCARTPHNLRVLPVHQMRCAKEANMALSVVIRPSTGGLSLIIAVLPSVYEMVRRM